MKSACEVFLIIVCCCLLLYILTAISIVAFVNNRNILFLSRPLCANSTIRPAETGSLEWVVQKQQHVRYWLIVNNIKEENVVKGKYSIFLSVSVPCRCFVSHYLGVLWTLQIFLVVSVLQLMKYFFPDMQIQLCIYLNCMELLRITVAVLFHSK